MSRTAFCILSGLLWSARLWAGDPEPDVLIFKNGEKLIGHLRSATAAKVVFVSDSAGVVTVDWSKVEELRSSSRFAAIPRQVQLRAKGDVETVPRGTLAMKDQKLQVTPAAAAAPRTIPVADVASVVPEKQFDHAFEPESLWKGWSGTTTIGASLLESTQENHTFTSMASLQRSSPSEGWLPSRFKTYVNFNSSYGLFRSPGVEPVKTNLFHADVEQDYYLTPRFFLLGGAMFDHNYAQGLDLMQGYGGGVGVVAVSAERDRLELRFGAGFTDQQWVDSASNHQFFGVRIGEFYSHRFGHGAVFTLDAGVRPGITYTRAFFGGYNASLTVPLYRRLAMNISSFDNWVNNPAPFFRKNVFQIAFGASYVIR
jgi:hypothetical protein